MSDNKQNNQQNRNGKGPGSDNGIPDDALEGESKGLPNSDREQSETAGKPDA